MHDNPAKLDKELQAEQIQEGENIHSIRQFFSGELKSLWPAWALGLIALIIIVWLQLHY